MQEYKVEIKETLSRIVMMEAENADEAVGLVDQMYSDCDVVLDASDFQDVEFGVV